MLSFRQPMQRQAALGRPRGTGRHCCAAVAANGADTSPLRDWRFQQMSDAARVLYGDGWSHGDTQRLEALLAPDCTYHDAVWAPQRPLVGPAALAAHIASVRTAYPDAGREIERIGMSDATHVFVHWRHHGTNLGPVQDAEGKRVHRASYHTSHTSGVDVLTFSEDRAAILDITSFRQPTHEERDFLDEAAREEGSALTIHLERLHWSDSEDDHTGPPVAGASKGSGSSSGSGAGNGKKRMTLHP